MGGYSMPYNSDQLAMGSIYGYYVKYDRLSKLINENFAGSNATTIDIFIDLHNIASKAFAYDQTHMPIQNNLFFTTGIINMCAHYREFFRRYYRTDSRMWLIGAFDLGMHSKHFAFYRYNPILDANQFSKLVDNMEILKLITPYIPNIETVDYIPKYDFSVIANRIIRYERSIGNNNPALIISKDSYLNILASELEDVFILRPKKVKSEDISYMITHNNCVVSYIESISNNPQITDAFKVNPYLLGIIMAMSRVPTRNMKTILRYDAAVQACLRAQASLPPITGPIWDIDNFLKLASIPKDTFDISCRYRALSSELMGSMYDCQATANLYKGIVNLYDPESLKRINEEYFKSNPLDLEVL